MSNHDTDGPDATPRAGAREPAEEPGNQPDADAVEVEHRHVPRPWHRNDQGEPDTSTHETSNTAPDASADQPLGAPEIPPEHEPSPIPRPWHDGDASRARQRPEPEPPPPNARGKRQPRQDRGPTEQRSERRRRRGPAGRKPGKGSRTRGHNRRPRRLTVAIALVVIAGVAAVFAFNFSNGRAPVITSTGVIGAHVHRLTPSRAVRVTAINVHPGQHVKSGEILVETSDASLRQKLSRINAKIAKLRPSSDAGQTSGNDPEHTDALRRKVQHLQSQLRQLGHQYASDQAKAQHLRNAADAGNASASQLSAAQTAVQQTKANYDRKAKRLRALQAKLHKVTASGSAASGHERGELASLRKARKHIQAKLKALAIRAPTDGIVSRVNAHVGERLAADQAAVVEAPVDDHQAVLFFPSRARSRLSTGQILTASTRNGTRVRMRIAQIFPNGKPLPAGLRRPASRAHNAIVVLASPVAPAQASHLPPGTQLRVRLSQR